MMPYVNKDADSQDINYTNFTEEQLEEEIEWMR